MTDVRVTQDAVEIVTQSPADARLTQHVVELLGTSVAVLTGTASVSQLAIESLTSSLTAALVSQYVVEALGGVLPAITITPPTLADAVGYVPYSQQLVASGGNGGPYTFTLQAGTLPPGLSLASSGQIVGTPPNILPVGTTPYALTVRATDALGSTGDQAYVVNYVVRAIVIWITPPTLPNAYAGLLYGVPLSASGGTGPYTFAVVAGALPTGLTLSPAGILAGTPPPTTATIGPPTLPPGMVDTAYLQLLTITAAPPASFVFTVRATDVHGDTGDQAYTLMLLDWLDPTKFVVTSEVKPLKCISLNPSGLFTGRPLQVSTTTFTVTATSGAGATVTRTYTIAAGPAS